MKARSALIAGGAVLVLLVGYRLQATVRSARKPEPPAAPVRVAAVRVARGDVAERVAVTGTIRARNEVEVHPELAGRIAAVHAKVGDRVRAGEVLAEIAHEELAWQAKAADAALAVARANLDGARLEGERTEELHRGGAATPAQLDAARVKRALCEAQVAQAAAAAGLAHQQVANARITTPVDGVVIRRPVDVGARVEPGTVAFAVHDLSALKLASAIEAADWARIGLGALATVTTDALPGETFAARVTLRAPALDPATRRAEVELALENPRGRLVPGMFARAELAAGAVRGALVIPAAAVVESPGGAIVWRIRGGKAEALRPRLGARDGVRVVVEDGLAEGDVVVTAGQGALVHGGAAEAVLGTPPDAAAAR